MKVELDQGGCEYNFGLEKLFEGIKEYEKDMGKLYFHMYTEKNPDGKFVLGVEMDGETRLVCGSSNKPLEDLIEWVSQLIDIRNEWIEQNKEVNK